MKKSLKYREALTDVRRVVVKIGSRVLVQKSGRPDMRRMRALIQQLSALHMEGKEVVVVTSGAVGAGMEALGLGERPATLPEQQMAAAVGQTRLMSRYSELFSARGVNVGQVLLTHHDFQHKIRLTNARRTMEIMIRNRVIPIINENDVVADNDYLAALVVKLIRADLLLLLTTVDGLREAGKSGRTRRVRYLETINRNTFALVTESRSRLSKGGMASKLKAAKSVSRAGCSAVIANGRKDDVIIRTMAGEDVGTLVLASAL